MSITSTSSNVNYILLPTKDRANNQNFMKGTIGYDEQIVNFIKAKNLKFAYF